MSYYNRKVLFARKLISFFLSSDSAAGLYYVAFPSSKQNFYPGEN